MARSNSTVWPRAHTLYSVCLIAVSIAVARIPLPWDQWGTLGGVGLFLVTFACGMMAFLPSPAYGVIYSAARGMGPFPAMLIGGVGWALGEMVLFHAGRGIPRAIADWTERYVPLITKILAHERRRFLFIFLVTLIPNPLFDVVSLLASRLGIRARSYFIPMAAARIARSAAISWLAVRHMHGA